MKSYSATSHRKTFEQYSSLVLFIMLYKVALTFEYVDEMLNCNHSYESC